ncbi:uncharacterized protein [Primulina eburnea]|uniref:uncharacterized protein n=1 Tax=Primulina eburnea TaxID=1245227 RepID=UPI003C6BECBD
MNAQMLAGMAQFFAQFAGGNAAAVAAAASRPTGHEAVYERFMKMRPKEFSGTSDPMVAEGWIKSLEVIFDLMELGDADRVRCATYLFTGDARLWWEGASVALTLATLSWTRFTEVFYSKYFAEEGAHFIRGLRAEIRRDINMSKAVTFKEIVAKALLVEQDEKDIARERHARLQAIAQRGQGSSQRVKCSFKRKGKVYPSSKAPTVPSDPEKPLCPKYSRHHRGECRFGTHTCYRCGTEGHIAKDCPRGSSKEKAK